MPDDDDDDDDDYDDDDGDDDDDDGDGDDDDNDECSLLTQRRIVSHGLGRGSRQPPKQPKWKQQQEQPSLWWALGEIL